VHFIVFLALSIFLVGADTRRVGVGSRLAEPISQRRPQGGLEAAAGSGTMDRRGRRPTCSTDLHDEWAWPIRGVSLYDAWQRYLPPESAQRCTICDQSLDQALVDAGFTDHGEAQQ
jgi:hypothetical protein